MAHPLLAIIQDMAVKGCLHAPGSNLSCVDDPRVVKPCYACQARVYLHQQPAQPKGWHCSACGLQHEEPTTWPFTCDYCQTQHFCSPKPVVVLILRAWDDESRTPGILAIRRGRQPYKDTWAFPGGYIDHKEDWRRSAVREAKEELGVTLDPRDITLWDAVTTPTNYLVLFVGYSKTVLTPDLWHAQPNTQTHGEIQEIRVLHPADQHTLQLGPPAHQAFWTTFRFQPQP